MHPEEYMNVPCYCCRPPICNPPEKALHHIFLHRETRYEELIVSKTKAEYETTREGDKWCRDWFFFTPTEGAVAWRI